MYLLDYCTRSSTSTPVSTWGYFAEGPRYSRVNVLSQHPLTHGSSVLCAREKEQTPLACGNQVKQQASFYVFSCARKVVEQATSTSDAVWRFVRCPTSNTRTICSLSQWFNRERSTVPSALWSGRRTLGLKRQIMQEMQARHREDQ